MKKPRCRNFKVHLKAVRPDSLKLNGSLVSQQSAETLEIP